MTEYEIQTRAQRRQAVRAIHREVVAARTDEARPSVSFGRVWNRATRRALRFRHRDARGALWSQR